MSATDFRRMIDVYRQGAIMFEVAGGTTLELSVVPDDTSVSGEAGTPLRLNFADAGELHDALVGALRVMIAAMDSRSDAPPESRCEAVTHLPIRCDLIAGHEGMHSGRTMIRGDLA